MPIFGIEQPEVIDVQNGIRLRRFDGVYDFAFEWYQDEDTVYMVDGVHRAYDADLLERMYSYLNDRGELYFIERLEKNGSYTPIGDVTLCVDDLPIVIGSAAHRGRGVGKAVIQALVSRAKAIGLAELRVGEIYECNMRSRKLFESMGFKVCGRTPSGFSYVMPLNGE